MHKSRFSLAAAIVSGLGAALLSLSVSAAPFSNLFVFGDSLSDAGNVSLATGGATETTPLAPSTGLVPGAPYAEGSGRFSNGPVWVEQLADDLGLSAAPALAGGTNFAFGGARTGPAGAVPPTPPTLTDQLGLFFGGTGGFAPSDALYTVWGGANDVRDAIVLAASDPIGAGGIVAAAVANIATIVGNLTAAGAVNILVPNLPDLGLTPALVLAETVSPGAQAAASFFTGQFNAGLAAALDPFIANPFLNIIELDIFSLLNTVGAAPGAFGLANVTDSCVDFTSVCSNPDDYLFWDGIHPTSAAHGIIADLAFAAVPEPSALMLMMAGLIFLGMSRRRLINR